MPDPTAPSRTAAPPRMRHPTPDDGPAVFRLIRDCPPLDQNSRYCNLLQCLHFADTAVAAEDGSGHLLGFISGYRLPQSPQTWFVWQVAVHPQARGRQLARHMLDWLWRQPALVGCTHLHTTISPGNEASWRTFAGFAEQRGAALRSRLLFDGQLHLDGQGPDEILVEIGPFQRVVPSAP